MDSANVGQAVFVAASVVAERLWSPRDTLDVSDAAECLVLMQQHMSRQGHAKSTLSPLNNDPI